MMVLEPAGAFSAMVFATPVSILTPPVAMMVPEMPWGMKKLPLASVMPSQRTLFVPSTICTVAPRMYPSATTPLAKPVASFPARS